jgi:hypothetical protein
VGGLQVGVVCRRTIGVSECLLCSSPRCGLWLHHRRRSAGLCETAWNGIRRRLARRTTESICSLMAERISECAPFVPVRRVYWVQNQMMHFLEIGRLY